MNRYPNDGRAVGVGAEGEVQRTGQDEDRDGTNPQYQRILAAGHNMISKLHLLLGLTQVTLGQYQFS